MELDKFNYLPNDILVKVDRASMANSLETRVPLLDHRIVYYSSKIPIKNLISSNDSKIILKKILFKYVPSN
jgi:asparagine synthase (glutamine-hydrolysing)